jgi:HEAT repeat protein
VARPSRPSSATALFALAAILTAALPAAAKEGPGPEADPLLAECRRILDEAGGRRPDDTASALAAKGPAVLPRLLVLHAEGGVPRRRETIALAFSKASGSNPVPGLLAVASGPDDLRLRLAALDLLRDSVAPAHIPALLSIVAGGDRDVRRTAESVVVSAISRIPERALAESLRRLHDSIPQPLRVHFAECVLLASRSPSMPFLASILGRNRTMDLLVLSGLGRMPPGEDCATLLEAIRGFLTDEDPAFRRQSAQALGQLQDPASAGELVRLLDDNDEGVRTTALWALRNLSGLDLPADPGRWRLWVETEQGWWEKRGRSLLADLESPDPAVVAEAIRLLGLSSLYRREVHARLSGLRESESGSVRAMVEAALGPAEPAGARPAAAGGEGLAWFDRRTSAPIPEDRPAGRGEPPPEVSRSGTWIATVIGGGVCLILLFRLLGLSQTGRRRKKTKAVPPGPITISIRHNWSKRDSADERPAPGRAPAASAPRP